LVISALVGEAGHPTAEELLCTLRRVAPDINASTVYRNLEELERLGVVVHTHLGHGAATYHLAEGAHGHLVCEKCGAVIEAPPDLFDTLARGAKHRLGFVLHPYHFAVLGLCAACTQVGPSNGGRPASAHAG
jgi:Fur family ferric uptake transcriptional regulator